MTTDTEPTAAEPSHVEGYEPPVDGETSRERQNRRKRNRRRAATAQQAKAAEAEPASTPAPAKPGRPSTSTKREASVLAILTGAGIAVLAFNEADGTAIIEGAPALAESLAKVAEKNRRVAKALDSLTETSDWAAVAMAAGAIVVPIVRNHLPSGEPEPEVEVEPAPTSTTEPVDTVPQVDPEAPVFTVRPPDTADAVPTFRA